MKEALLEPLLRPMRFRQVLPIVAQYRDCEMLDSGCGWEAILIRRWKILIAIPVR
jgi:hypothetical protein